MGFPYVLGQIIGVIAMAILFISYQFKDQKKLITVQTIGVLAMCVHYLLIEATSGLVLNIICLMRNICYANRDKKILSGVWVPIFFAATVAAVGFLSWESYYSLFIIAGLVINTLYLSGKDTQKLRYSILLTSPLVFIYDIFVLSIGGMANEALTVVSAIIGIVRINQAKKKS